MIKYIWTNETISNIIQIIEFTKKTLINWLAGWLAKAEKQQAAIMYSHYHRPTAAARLRRRYHTYI